MNEIENIVKIMRNELLALVRGEKDELILQKELDNKANPSIACIEENDSDD